jgi:hypothetical protein
MYKPLNSLERVFNPALTALGFTEVERDEPRQFDNGMIIYQKDDLRIRIIIDRGSPLVDIERIDIPGDWLDVQLVKNYLDNQGANAVSEPNEIAAFIARRFSQIADNMMHRFHDLKSKVDNFSEERAKQFLLPNANAPVGTPKRTTLRPSEGDQQTKI